MVKTFSDWIKQTLKNTRVYTYFLSLRQGSRELWQYDDIPFKLFVSITSIGGLNRLLKSGVATEEELSDVWELIVKRNSEVSNSYRYGTYFQLMKSYLNLINEHTAVKAMLLHLYIQYDAEIIATLKKKRYIINTDNNVLYDESLEAAGRKVENLLTKINMKFNEIQEFQKLDKGGKESSFEELMATLTMSLGFVVADDITLARYNEYHKMLERKSATNKSKVNG